MNVTFKTRRPLCFALALAVFLAASCGESGQGSAPISKMIDGPLDTVSIVTIYDGGNESAIEAVFDMLKDTDARMSAPSPDSELSAVSNSAGSGTFVPVSRDTYSVIECAIQVSEQSKGAFDITISPVVLLWGIGKPNAKIPDKADIDTAVGLVGYQGILLDPDNCAVSLEREGMRLDLGAIAKGFACDRAAEILKAAGAKSAIVDLGGNIYALGTKPDGSSWNIGVRCPLAGENGYFCVASVTDTSVVTSGAYERYSEIGGKTYHHIMDPWTGWPSDSGLVSVTIICESSTRADALSTACFVLGLDRARDFLATQDDVGAILVTSDLGVCITGTVSGKVRITDDRFLEITD